MTRFSRLIRECAWKWPGCHRLIGWSEPTAPGKTGISHGLCPACAERMRKEQHD